MKYDFSTQPQRRDTDSYKWDSESADILPLWVADMDFTTAPCIIEALQKRVSHGIFGYTRVPDDFYQAVIDWFSERHGLEMSPGKIIYTSGVVPALSAVIKAVTMPGEGVIVQTPVYNCFFSSILNNGCRVVSNELTHLPDGSYEMNFEELERLCTDEKNTALILCNPHNPVGRVWSCEELTRLGEICLRHNVTVISDEIHCELTFDGHNYVPFASISQRFAEHSATCISPSKAFNIAGLQIACIYIKDARLRRRTDRAININEVCDVNPFGVRALIAAYTEGAGWLEELKKYLWENYLHLRDFFSRELPNLQVTPLEGTYLVWVDCRPLGMSDEALHERLLREGKVWVHPGNLYGCGGEGFIRINIACPRTTLDEAMHRMARVLAQ